MTDKGFPTPEKVALEAEANAKIEKLRKLGESLSDVESSTFELILGNSSILVSQFGDTNNVGQLLENDKADTKGLHLLLARRLLGNNSNILDMTPEALGRESHKLSEFGIQVQLKTDIKYLEVTAPTVIPGLNYVLDTLSFYYDNPELPYMSIGHKITN